MTDLVRNSQEGSARSTWRLRRLRTMLLFTWVPLLASTPMCTDPSCWQNKVVYQVLIDRFARNDTSYDEPCVDLATYCGGTWRGLYQKLDYIVGLGVDGIWISPVVDNVPNGYMGYWAKSFTELNPHFGTQQDLEQLIDGAHKRGLLMMIDAVANHMGQNWTSVATLDPPYNDASLFHDCVPCQAASSQYQPGCVSGSRAVNLSKAESQESKTAAYDNGFCSCWVQDYNNEQQLLYCQLFGLPDLNQSHPLTRELLLNFAKSLKGHGFDGARIDTVPYVPLDFWIDFHREADMYFMGEYFDPDVTKIALYPRKDAMDSMLNFPLYYQLINCFTKRWSFRALTSTLSLLRDVFPNASIPRLGAFSESADVQRLPSLVPDPVHRKSLVLYTLTAEGMPILYYGTEQGFVGGGPGDYDSYRPPMWTTGFSTDGGDVEGVTYQFVAKVNKLRRRIPRPDFADAPQQEMWSSATAYAFKRGQVVVAVTNDGRSGGSRSIFLQNTTWSVGTIVCNLFDPSDCIYVSQDNHAEITLVGGEPKVYAPSHYVCVDGVACGSPSSRESGVGAVKQWASQRISMAEAEFNQTNATRHPSPAAWSDHVIYSVMLDRFANGDPSNDRANLLPDQRERMDTSQLGGMEAWRHGGDLRGVLDRLDYLVDLGVDVLYVSPAFHHTGSYHGYCTIDFTSIDPGFGTNDEFRRLVTAAHARGIRVILDIVQHLCIPQAVYSTWPGPECTTLNYEKYQAGEHYESAQAGTLDFGSVIFPPFDTQEFFYRCGPTYFADHPNRSQELFGDLRWGSAPSKSYLIGRDSDSRYSDSVQARRMDEAIIAPPSAPSGNYSKPGEDRIFALNDLNPDFQQIYVDIMKWWVAYADIDGYRLDNAKAKTPAWEAIFSVSLRAYAQSLGKSNFLVAAEILSDGQTIKEYVGNMLNASGDTVADAQSDLRSTYENLHDPSPGVNSAYDFPRHFKLVDVLQNQVSPRSPSPYARMPHCVCRSCLRRLRRRRARPTSSSSHRARPTTTSHLHSAQTAFNSSASTISLGSPSRPRALLRPRPHWRWQRCCSGRPGCRSFTTATSRASTVTAPLRAPSAQAPRSSRLCSKSACRPTTMLSTDRTCGRGHPFSSLAQCPRSPKWRASRQAGAHLVCRRCPGRTSRCSRARTASIKTPNVSSHYGNRALRSGAAAPGTMIWGSTDISSAPRACLRAPR